MDNKNVFDFFRRKKRYWTKNPAVGLTQGEVNDLNAILSPAEAPSEPLPPKPDTGLASKIGPLAGIVGALAATSLLTIVPTFEGTSYAAYKDVAGIWTICQGDTKNVRGGLIETPEGCRQRLESQLVIHAKGVMACTPRLKEDGHDWQRAATVSLTYNIGVGGYCRSSVDKKFDAGDWVGGCNSFLVWNKARVNGVLRPVQGLTKRRNQERTICLKGLV